MSTDVDRTMILIYEKWKIQIIPGDCTSYIVRFKNKMLINITSYHIMVITLIKQPTVPLTLTAAELTILCINDKHASCGMKPYFD